MEALEFVLPEPPSPFGEIRRFSAEGTVVVQGTLASVYVGGTLIGVYDEDDDDRGPRNVLLVTLAKTGEFRIGRLSAAFGMTSEHLRRLRRTEEVGGLGAVIVPRQGKSGKVTPEVRAAWFAMFDEGRMPIDAHREQPRRDRRAYSTVWMVWEHWRREQASRRTKATAAIDAPASTSSESQLPLWSTTDDLGEPSSKPTPEESDEIVPMTAQPVRGGKVVQHAGCWILLALVGELGLYEEAQTAFVGRHPDGLRIALDAVICALAIRQLVVEGVRRLATPSGATLLRAERVPTASGVRKLLYRLLEQTDGGAALERQMTERLLATTKHDGGPAVFYVDNHLRPYTGKQVVRKGWRMQDRRVLPGTSDYYVHDEDGIPVFRVAVPSHDSLATWLPPVAARLREALGDDEQIVLAFDRAGAHAELLAALRDSHFDFVTYERAPYPELPTTVFAPITIAGEHVGLYEGPLRNLGQKRGRIRRIAVRTEDGRQVNFLASSTLPAERLVEILWHRWCQENAFKHGVERWGINQLDGRGVETYPPGTIIPNPARRRLERALRIARVAEGDARRDLARFNADHPRFIAATQDLADALDRQEKLLDLRPFLPKHALVENTELADSLVKHDGKLKSVIDVIRVVCANAESELATLLAPHMTRPREAKKLLANLFAAPGTVVVTDHAVHVRLAPAANKAELVAIGDLLAKLNQRGLILPSDHKRLPLRFELARTKP
ncbi:MAG: hypothetical protein M3680_36420 [Myxococcota bacterium]|nr:hypothetical protein [Myxococcota bacterium]